MPEGVGLRLLAFRHGLEWASSRPTTKGVGAVPSYFLGDELLNDRKACKRAAVVRAARKARAGYCQISMDGMGVRRVLVRSGGAYGPAVGGAYFRTEAGARAFAARVSDVVNAAMRADRKGVKL